MSDNQLDLFIKGGTVVSSQGVVRANVGIRDGRIATVCEPDLELPALRVVDATGKHILPGVIDPHVHMTSNSRSMAESCQLETPSMAAGGVTTIFHHSQSYESYLPVWEKERAAVNRHSLIDVGFHAIVMKEQHVEELPLYARAFGVTSCKMYMAAAGRELYPGTLSVDDGLLVRAFQTVSRLARGEFPHALAMVHAENWEVAWALAAQLQAEGREDAAAWTDARPAWINEESMRRAIFLARQQDCPLYIVHCPVGSTPQILEEGRAQGATVYGETCPHYLTIYREHERALYTKYNPSIQRQEDAEGLWRGLIDGIISTVGSDHIPVRAKDKDVAGKNIWTVRGGAPGSSSILPVLLSQGYHKRGMSLERVVEVSSTNAAKLLGLYPRKGAIAAGSDADLVLVELEKEVRLRPNLLKLDWVLHDGWDFKGWPVMTMVRGQVVMEDGEIVAQPGAGRYVRDVVPAGV